MVRSGQPQLDALAVELAPQRIEQGADRIDQISKQGVDERSRALRLCEITGRILSVVRRADILAGNAIFALPKTGIANKVRGDLFGDRSAEAFPDVQASDV